MTWSFPLMQPGEMNVDPFEREFFATEELGSRADALVRESIQNALDASTGDGCVRVRFKLGRASGSARRRYLSKLVPHVGAALGEPSDLCDDGPLDYLAIEDSGTRGLEGDPHQYDDRDDEAPQRRKRNDYYYFWRNVGRSRKVGDERGRWGLGKTVFPAASRLHAFFGLTVRKSDGRRLLMGQAVLRIHRLGQQRFRPYGYFGEHDASLALPIEKASELDAFARTFGLDRAAEPGLSVVVPDPDPEIDSDRLVRSVVRHYFHPLLAGRLEVHVEDDRAASGGSVMLRADCLDGFIASWSPEEHSRVQALLELARWGLETDEVVRLGAPRAGAAPRFSPALIGAEELDGLRTRFDRGKPIALEIPIPIVPRDRRRRLPRLLLLIERDESGHRGEGHFVRQGITIENPRAKRPRGARWIVVIDDSRLSAFLGDAENPAHTEWQRSSSRLKKGYERGPSTLDYIRSLPQNLATQLSRPAAGRDPDLLRDLFSIPEESVLAEHRGAKETEKPAGKDGAGESEFGELGENDQLALERIDGGFRLAGRASERGAERLEVLAAYQVLRGNPFRRYSSLDFRFDAEPVRLTVAGARIVDIGEQDLVLERGPEPFELVALGFDPHRDLRIRVRELDGDGSER